MDEVPQRHDRAGRRGPSPTCRSSCASRSAATTRPTSSRPTTPAATWAPSSRPGCCGRSTATPTCTAGTTASPSRCGRWRRTPTTARRSARATCTASRSPARWSGVWYNKAKLDELGIDPPQTVEDFEAALQTAKDAGEIPIQFGNLDQWPGIHEFGFVQNQFVPPRRHPQPRLRPGRARPGRADENKQAAETLGRLGRQGLLHRRLQRSRLRPGVAGLRQGQGRLPDLRHLAAGRPAGRDGRRPRLHAAAGRGDRRASR